ncbi:MAG: 50S ribosomal protein L29 [Pseudomonadota bacterium]|nr:50S ribosomal protein L29 [Pseudomonadota bacterium]
MSNVEELRQKSPDELRALLIELSKQQFRQRIQQATSQLGQTHLLSAVRKDIARVKTVLNEKQVES